MLEIREGLDCKDDIVALISEYTDMLLSLNPEFRVYLDIQHYDDEIADLSLKYGRPEGRLYAAYIDGKAVGCIGLRKLDDERCELKRLYVRKEARGQGLSRILMDLILREAREIGYKTMLLDTLPELDTAIKLYEKYGFDYTDRYNDSPAC